MTLTVGITLVAVSMAAITAIIAVVQQLHIQSLQSEKKDLKQAFFTSHKHHAIEREVTTKLAADLLEADNHFDALAKESKQIALKRDEWYKKYLDVRRELEAVKTRLKQYELERDIVKYACDEIQRKYTDLIAMPRRKRETLIRELRRGQYVKVNTEVEP